MISPLDPPAIYEANPNITPEDMAKLKFRLGLGQPAFLNFRGSSGIVTALKRYSTFDHFFTILAYAGRSIPISWFGLILIIVFHSTLTWPAFAPAALARKPLFPGGGMYDVRLAQNLGCVLLWNRVWHLVLPVTMLAVFGAAQYMCYTRSSMLEVIHQDHIRTAFAKGLAE